MDGVVDSFRLENFDFPIVPFAAGLALVLFLSVLVEPYLRWLTRDMSHSRKKSKPHRESDDVRHDQLSSAGKVWRRVPGASRVIGIFESVVFYAAIVVQYPVFIGAWLAFTVAAKWQTFAQVVRMPELPKDVKLNSRKFARRNKYATLLHTRFVLRTLLNIAIAAMGAWLYVAIGSC